MRTNRHSKEEILSKINSIIMDNDISWGGHEDWILYRYIK
jgi:hypothetical protein